MKSDQVWLTVLLLLALVFCLVVSQPKRENLAQLMRLQQQLVALYQQYRQNATAVDLERFMDSQLIIRTRGIIDLIRGWSIDAGEEAINAETSINYLRSVVLYTCIGYADSLYDAYSTLDLNPEALLQASEIFRIRSNYEWVPRPSDSIVRFELTQFHQLDIRARAINETPFVQVYSTNTTSARFFHEIFTPSSIFFTNSISMCSDLSPVHRNPQSNILREVRMLIKAQNVVLTLNALSDESSILSLHDELFYLNDRLDCIMRETLNNFMRQNYVTKTRYEKDTLRKIMSLVILERFMQFVLAKFVQHVNHPAYARYSHVLDVNMMTTLNVNHRRLMRTYNDLLASLNRAALNSNLRRTFRALIFDMPLRVGYVCYGERFALRVGLACQNSN